MQDNRSVLKVPDDFSEWFWKSMRTHWKIPSLGIGIPTIATVVSKALQQVNDWPWLLFALYVFQLAVILVMLFATPNPLSNDALAARASRGIEQFHQAWRRLLLVWALLYIVLAVKELSRVGMLELNHYPSFITDPQGFYDKYLIPYSLPIANIVNNIQSAALLMCYMVLARTTINMKRAANPLPWEIALGIAIVLFVAEIIIVMIVMSMGGSDQEMLNRVNYYQEIFSYISGFAGGIALALLVGRLDSNAIQPPIKVVVLLYLYAVLQGGWGAVEKKPEMALIFVNAALILKTIFFLFVAWLFRSGVLTYYLDRIGNIREAIPEERRSFLAKLQGIEVK